MHGTSIQLTRSTTLNPSPAHPPIGLFAMTAEAIADQLASKEVSPQGPASGLRLLAFYISHSAKRLNPSRLRNLEKARKLLAARLEQQLRHKTAA
jgi:tRNA(adenine34) deaminase